MIFGTHTIVFSADADADRAFLRDVLGLDHVDAGGGWLIFALPPSEVAVHPDGGAPRHELYLLSDDLAADVARLAERGVVCGPVSEERWGSVTAVSLPGGGTLGLYQPRHPLAITPTPGADVDDRR